MGLVVRWCTLRPPGPHLRRKAWAQKMAAARLPWRPRALKGGQGLRGCSQLSVEVTKIRCVWASSVTTGPQPDTFTVCLEGHVCGWEFVRDSACGLATAGKSVAKSTLSPSVVAACLSGTLFACKIR